MPQFPTQGWLKYFCFDYLTTQVYYMRFMTAHVYYMYLKGLAQAKNHLKIGDFMLAC